MEEDKNATKEAEIVATQDVGLDPEEDLQAKYDALQVEREKILADNLNYKKALENKGLKKKVVKSDGDDEQDEEIQNVPADIDEMLDRKIAEKLSNTEQYRIQKEQEEITRKALKENKELKLALKTKSTTASSGAGQGGNQDHAKSDVSYFTEAQLAEIKAREQRTGIKIDLKKLEAEMRKISSK